ncbi:hypothetical protein ACH427_16740 [Streptomyces sp. NPDC020379]|uniref:hypothetical protein n=1 Tax=Streptomyces sp. NPDC020379 TaxID=3365071 RepID=UPI0037B08349
MTTSTHPMAINRETAGRSLPHDQETDAIMTTPVITQPTATAATTDLAQAVGTAVLDLLRHTRTHPPAHSQDVYAALGELVGAAQHQAAAYEETAAAVARMHHENRLRPYTGSDTDTETHVRKTVDALYAAAHHARQLDNALGRAQAGLFYFTDGDGNA